MLDAVARMQLEIRETLETLPARQRKFIVTDGIFSMEGDVAPMDVNAALAGLLAALDLLETEPAIQDRLRHNVIGRPRSSSPGVCMRRAST